jgi:uncharacterized protein YjbI with pentapeptide repeats
VTRRLATRAHMSDMARRLRSVPPAARAWAVGTWHGPGGRGARRVAELVPARWRSRALLLPAAVVAALVTGWFYAVRALGRVEAGWGALLVAVLGAGVFLMRWGARLRLGAGGDDRALVHGDLMAETGVAITTGAMVGFVLFAATWALEENLSEREARQEDVRFVRELATQPDAGAKPFDDLDLREARLAGLDLSDAHLSDADLSGADLDGTQLRNAVITGADLRDADMSRADLRNADLTGALLSGADLSDADLDPIYLTRADLSGADLSGAALAGSDLSGANLSGVDLSRADLHGVDLTDVDLGGADLSGADLTDAFVTHPGADLSGTDLSDTSLRDADLVGVDLSGADMRGADLSGADLSGADLTHAAADDATVWP